MPLMWMPRRSHKTAGSRATRDVRFRAGFEDASIQPTAGDGADDRRNPEHPQLRERPPADEQSRSGAARRIHRRVGHRDADQVNQRQRKTDRDAGETDRRTLMRRPENDEEK